MATAYIVAEGSELKVETPYSPELVRDLKNAVPPAARKWVRNEDIYGDYVRRGGHWRVGATYLTEVKSLCERHGLNVELSGKVEVAAPRTVMFQLDYMGLVYHRGGTTYTANGWVNGGWNASFPLEVLQEWFHFTVKPGEMPDLYSTLGVDPTLQGIEFDKALKKAHRIAARTYHPDVNKEPDAEEVFKAIQEAYESLKDPNYRQQYDAGLIFQEKIDWGSSIRSDNNIKWRPPVRCGMLTTTSLEVMGKYQVEKIMAWEDITDGFGKTMVTYWVPGSDHFDVKWVS